MSTEMTQGKDQFHMIITSDGGSELYKDNKTSNFKIDLSDPINIGEESWEVALLSISYPRTWVNIGDAAGVYMSYYINDVAGAHDIHFPNWQCQTVEELEQFLMTEITEREKKFTYNSKILIKLDELGRVKIWSNEPRYDVGFSDNMLRILGLVGHPRMNDLQIDAFQKRDNQRRLLDIVCKKKKFDYIDRNLVNALKVCVNIDIFENLMAPYLGGMVDEGIFKDYSFDPKKEDLLNLLMNQYRGGVLNKSPGGYKQKRLLGMLMIEIQELLRFQRFPQTLKGVTPGIIDPIQRMFVYLNVLADIEMNNTTSKILKVVNTRGEPMKMTQEDFANPIYLPVQKGRHNLMHVYIKNDQGENVPFQSGTVLMILHFRRKAK